MICSKRLLAIIRRPKTVPPFPIATGIRRGTVIKERSNDYFFMNFQSAELTQQVAQTARDFAQQYIRPHVMEWTKARNSRLQRF
jgi:hypothetical protein